MSVGERGAGGLKVKRFVNISRMAAFTRRTYQHIFKEDLILYNEGHVKIVSTSDGFFNDRRDKSHNLTEQ